MTNMTHVFTRSHNAEIV